MHEQDPQRHENASDAEARAAAALASLVRLMGRLAAQEQFAASSDQKDEGHEEAAR